MSFPGGCGYSASRLTKTHARVYQTAWLCLCFAITSLSRMHLLFFIACVCLWGLFARSRNTTVWLGWNGLSCLWFTIVKKTKTFQVVSELFDTNCVSAKDTERGGEGCQLARVFVHCRESVSVFSAAPCVFPVFLSLFVVLWQHWSVCEVCLRELSPLIVFPLSSFFIIQTENSHLLTIQPRQSHYRLCGSFTCTFWQGRTIIWVNAHTGWNGC